jgi:serine/threonine-protein kinase
MRGIEPFLRRLREHKLFQWAAAYLAGAWLLLQALDVLDNAFHWPDAIQQGMIALLAVGLLAALVVAWYHGEKGRQRVSGVELLMLAGILALAAGVLSFVRREPSTDEARVSLPVAAAPAPAAPARHVAEQGSIAVLPFLDLSEDHDQAYFSDGLSEELLDAFSKLPELRVAARTSSFSFRDKDVPVDSIGRALRVANVLEGSVRKSGDRVRITTQLIDASTGYQLWSETYDRELKDVFALEDEISRAVVQALQVRLAGTQAGSAQGTTDPEAYELYLKGHYYFLLRGADNVVRGIGYFRQAIERDPSFARAHAGLALAYSVLPAFVPGAGDSATALTVASAERAVALDSTLADAQLALATALDMRLRFREALEHYRASLRLEPWNAFGHHAYGFALLNLGHTDEAIAELRQGTELDPLARSAASAFALAFTFARRYPEAIDASRRAQRIDSVFPLTLWGLGVAQAFEGEPDSAVLTLERLERLNPEGPGQRSALLFAYASAGRWDDAARIRSRLHRRGGDLSSGVEAAFADLVFGDPQPMLRLVVTGTGPLRWIETYGALGCHPFLDPLRSEPAFTAAMRRLAVKPCDLARPWPLPPRPTP